MRTTEDWTRILRLCGVRNLTATLWAPVFADTIRDDTFSAGDADLQPFLGQILHESSWLTRLEEGLSYSAERLMQVWPRRFPTLGDAYPYEHNPEALANRVYGGRMGNVNPGDGWAFRGRTPIQITGRGAYAVVGGLMGQDLEANPELLDQPHFALEACIHWWEQRIPDDVLGDTEKVTRLVNGGEIGLAEREKLTDLVGEVLNA
jgi:putative chitinase